MTTPPHPQIDHLDQSVHCAYCGDGIPAGAATYERFGERFCSEQHAEAFAEGVRAQRIAAVAQRQEAQGAKCAQPATAPQGWADRLKRAACWGAPLLLLLAIPMLASGGALAVGGSVLSLLAVLACPLGMYFMMRTMGGMHRGDAQHPGPRPEGKPSSPARGGER